ncbi:MAG TPA: hypothetical protein VJQ45_03020, partial [Ktedonobacterales bacterium]|nr:hypothetical protein [Ktedonobacterales bacterium]
TWSLPSLTAGEPPEIAAELRRTLGLDATVLERLWERQPPPHLRGHSWPPPGEPAHRIYAIEPLRGDDDWQPPRGMRWVGAAELASLRAANDEHAAPVAAWLDERAHGFPPRRVPWAIPGWRDEALAWTERAAGTAGYRIAGPPQQIKVSPWSTVWRIPIEAGQLYFKTAHPGQAYEAVLSRMLGIWLAPRVPRTTGADPRHGWMLIEDGGRGLRDRALAEHGPDLSAAYLPEFARLQRAATPYVEQFLAAGCPDFRLARLSERFAALLANPDLLLVGEPGGMPEDEYAQLMTMAPEVSAICARLAAYGIPETLHHDDLGPGNVLESASDGLVFFDWAESAVTHPFCSLMIPLRWARLIQECDDAALDTLRDAYLAPWADYGSPHELRAALGLAHRLGYLCRALTYADLLIAMEPRAAWELADAPAYWLRLFLRDAPPGGDVPDMG